MMYRHQIDEHIERYEAELRLYRRMGRKDFADHVARRIESWKKIRKKAPDVMIGVK